MKNLGLRVGTLCACGLILILIEVMAAEPDKPEYQEKPVYMRTTAPATLLPGAVFQIMVSPQTNAYSPPATGFYVQLTNVTFGVTARHVLQEGEIGKWGALRTNLLRRTKHSQRTNETYGFPLFPQDIQPPIVFFHTNAFIDEAVFPILTSGEVAEEGNPLPFSFLQPDSKIALGEDVHIFGFPGPYGFDQGKPVIRSGTICYKLNPHYYLLDANLWQGDSGGLVVSKPYFGVPEGELVRYQWQMGGKILGLQSSYTKPAVFGLPPELAPYRTMASSQGIIEIFESPACQEFLKKNAEAIPVPTKR